MPERRVFVLPKQKNRAKQGSIQQSKWQQESIEEKIQQCSRHIFIYADAFTHIDTIALY